MAYLLFPACWLVLLLVLTHWKETARSYRPPLIALMCGQLIPIITAFVYFLDFSPFGLFIPHAYLEECRLLRMLYFIVSMMALSY
ncbi:hypothetical protein [Lysinibacillus sphaericus]|uniref:hypothetical protein n=1 Tax=Lysinibacillus sphaericus TaxID=1421 RepID=UPI001EF3BED8|nr:hypothetical protein [Lysinibacillus sphaericus]